MEVRSVLLAASLKRFLKCDYEIVAAIPDFEGLLGKPDDLTISILRDMDVRTVDISNNLLAQYPVSIEYLLTNKIYCLKVPTDADKIIFLDSDILCVNEFHDDSRYLLEFNAKTASYPGTKPTEGRWKKLYDAVGAEMPKLRSRIASNDGHYLPLYVPPYFNSGIIAIKRELASEMSDVWLECFNMLDISCLMKHHMFFQEQVSMSLAVQKMGLEYEIMGKEIGEIFFHYHQNAVAVNTPKTNKLIKSIVKEYPQIGQMLVNSLEWKDVMAPMIIKYKNIITSSSIMRKMRNTFS